MVGIDTTSSVSLQNALNYAPVITFECERSPPEVSVPVGPPYLMANPAFRHHPKFTPRCLSLRKIHIFRIQTKCSSNPENILHGGAAR
jgi:hypothetical protein